MKNPLPCPFSILAVAAGAALFSPAAQAACEFDIEVGDTLQYSTDVIEADADCESITIHLTHTGKLPAAAMGHNWVLSADSDFRAVANAGMASGLEQDYLPPDDERVLAATEVIGGGESTRIEFSIDALDPDGSYTFFCSFPGHWAAMKGTFRLI